MNVFLRELRTYRKSTLIWAASLSALVLVFMSMFPAFTKTSRRPRSPRPAARGDTGRVQHPAATFFTVYGFYGYLWASPRWRARHGDEHRHRHHLEGGIRQDRGLPALQAHHPAPR